MIDCIEVGSSWRVEVNNVFFSHFKRECRIWSNEVRRYGRGWGGHSGCVFVRISVHTAGKSALKLKKKKKNSPSHQVWRWYVKKRAKILLQKVVKFCMVVGTNLPSTRTNDCSRRGNSTIRSRDRPWSTLALVASPCKFGLVQYVRFVASLFVPPYFLRIFLFVRSPYPSNFVSPSAGLKLGIAQA